MIASRSTICITAICQNSVSSDFPLAWHRTYKHSLLLLLALFPPMDGPDLALLPYDTIYRVNSQTFRC